MDVSRYEAYLPTAHGMHDEAVLDPLEAVDVPSGQDVQEDELELAANVPMGHAVQEEADPVAYVASGQVWHAVLPWDAENFPPGHP